MEDTHKGGASSKEQEYMYGCFIQEPGGLSESEAPSPDLCQTVSAIANTTGRPVCFQSQPSYLCLSRGIEITEAGVQTRSSQIGTSGTAFMFPPLVKVLFRVLEIEVLQ